MFSSTGFRYLVVVAVLVLAFSVALAPAVVFAPTPRVVLYLLVSLLPAILLASEASAQFKLELPGFVFTCAGAAAIMFGCLWLLTKITKPEQQIMVYEVHDASGRPVVGLDEAGSLDISLSDTGLQVTKFVAAHRVVLIFPEQVPEARVTVQLPGGAMYRGTVSYAGTRVSTLQLGKELGEVR